jgi:penicillin-binding protein 1A
MWLGSIALVGLIAFTVLYQRCGLHGCPDVDMLKGYMPDQASVVLDRNGEELAKLFVTQRTVVPIDSIPEQVQNAFVAIEDQRFWQHGGVDWRRVLGALVKNVKSGGIEEGSSTITMQLARNVFPEKLPANQRTLWRKLGEARVARQIEGRYEKKEILELYLNQIYFGHGAYGIEAAAQEYFAKHASGLNLAEAATLASLPRAPSRLNPRSNPEAAHEGRKLVLDRMQAQGFVTAEEAAEAADVKLKLKTRDAKTQDRAPYFVEAVRRLLEDELGDAIYTQGYTIRTTLDLKMQTALEEELSKQLRAVESGAFGRFIHTTYAVAQADTSASPEGGTKYLQGAGLIMDARTGDVLALVGGRDYDDSEFNRATQAKRQPGSAFKPFVYAAAIESGLPPTHRLLDRPLRYVLDNGRVWEPGNYSGTFAGAVTMRDALTNSRNVPTVRLAMEVGLSRVQQLAETMGMGQIPSNPAVVLGTSEVTPLQLTQAYGAFATLGQRPDARFVAEITDRDGGSVWSQSPQSSSVIDPSVAFVTTSILEDVVNRGTATAVRAAGFRGAAAGKTGTTQDAADIWFVGYTPQVVGTIWIGFDKRKTIVRGGSGGVIAAPVWGRVMARVAGPAEEWLAPGGVETAMVDAKGDVVSEGCVAQGGTHTEYFLRGTTPVNYCYGPSFYAYDSLQYDQYQLNDLEAQNMSWWDRMRAKYLDDDTSQMALPPAQADPIYETDTAALRRQRDSIANTPIGDPVRLPPNPTIRVDTARPGRQAPPPPAPTPSTIPGTPPPPAPLPNGVPVPYTIPIVLHTGRRPPLCRGCNAARAAVPTAGARCVFDRGFPGVRRL